MTAALFAQAPPPAGFSAERLGRLKAALKESVDKKEFAGIHAAVMRKGRLALSESFGFADLEAGKPMRADTIMLQIGRAKVFESSGKGE